MIVLKRALLGTTTLALAVGLGAAVPDAAHAGGGNQYYVYGSTHDQCEANLSSAIHSQANHGKTISGIHHCRLTGDRSRYFGDFVAN